MRFLKQSTQVIKLVGPFLDKTDGVTEESGLAATATEISKDGAAFGAGPVLGTHDSDGWYPITLTTTHTNTVGDLVVKCHDAATHLPVWCEFTVLEEAIYDALFAASANAFSGAAGSTTLTALASDSITAAVVATGAIDADALATDAAQEIADALLDRANGIETSYTLRQALRLILSASVGKLNGAATTTVNIRDVGDSKNRISATVDASGNRSAVTLDAT